jgi:23S rRNA (adenine2030-N6)-methyltransferase
MIFRMDAAAAAKALLPPAERRGVLLIDPPYEAADEARRALAALSEGRRRFATAVFLLWYPVKAQADANALARRAGKMGLAKTLRAEMTVRRADKSDRLNGSGLILVNPPWRLEAELALILPALAERLQDPQARFAGGFRLEWLVDESEEGSPKKKMPDPRGGSGRLERPT